MQRPVALRPDRGRERMVVRLGVVADDLHLSLDEPVGGGLAVARVTYVIRLASNRRGQMN